MKKWIFAFLFSLTFVGPAAAALSAPGGANPWRVRGSTAYVDNRQIEIRDGAEFSILYGTSTACSDSTHRGRISISTTADSGEWLYICEGASGWVVQGGGAIVGAASTRYELNGDFIVNTTTFDVRAPLVVADDSGSARLSVNSSSVTLQGNTFNSASSLLQINSSGYVPNSLIDPSSVTKLGATITESEITFNTNDGTRHDHTVADITDANAGSDLTSDLEEENHSSEHENGAADEISVEGLSGLLADSQQVTITTGTTDIITSSRIAIVAGSNISISAAQHTSSGTLTITALPSSGTVLYVYDGPTQVVQTSTITFSTNPFIVTDNSGNAYVDLSSTVVTLLGSATNQASAVAYVESDGYVPSALLDPSSFTKVGATIEEAEVVFETNDGSRHDHLAVDISNLNAGTDLTADLEEDVHSSEHEDGGNDEIDVTGLSGQLADVQLVTVSTAGSSVGNFSQIDFSEGANASITATGYTSSVTISIAVSTGSTVAAGSDGEIQVNSGGVLGSSSTFNWNGSTMAAPAAEISTITSVSQIRWADGTIQVSSPSASGAGSASAAGSAGYIQFHSTSTVGEFDANINLTYDPVNQIFKISESTQSNPNNQMRLGTNDLEYWHTPLAGILQKWGGLDMSLPASTRSRMILSIYGNSALRNFMIADYDTTTLRNSIAFSNADVTAANFIASSSIQMDSSGGGNYITVMQAYNGSIDELRLTTHTAIMSELRFKDDNGSNYVVIKASDEVDQNMVLVLPTTATAVDQAFKIESIDTSLTPAHVYLKFDTDETGGGSGGGYDLEPATVPIQVATITAPAGYSSVYFSTSILAGMMTLSTITANSGDPWLRISTSMAITGELNPQGGITDTSLEAADFGNEDHGDFTYSGGSATLDNDVVAAAEMADADHGDVSWSGGVATVDNVAAANVAAGNLGGSVLASSVTAAAVTAHESALEAVIDGEDLQSACSDSEFLSGDGAGGLECETPAGGSSDDLGNHVATTTLNMAGFGIVSVASMTMTSSSAPVVSSTWTKYYIRLTDTADNDFALYETSATLSGNKIATTRDTFTIGIPSIIGSSDTYTASGSSLTVLPGIHCDITISTISATVQGATGDVSADLKYTSSKGCLSMTSGTTIDTIDTSSGQMTSTGIADATVPEDSCIFVVFTGNFGNLDILNINMEASCDQ